MFKIGLYEFVFYFICICFLFIGIYLFIYLYAFYPHIYLFAFFVVAFQVFFLRCPSSCHICCAIPQERITPQKPADHWPYVSFIKFPLKIAGISSPKTKPGNFSYRSFQYGKVLKSAVEILKRFRTCRFREKHDDLNRLETALA